MDVQAQDPGSIPGRVARQTRGEDNHIPSVAEPAAVAVAVAATSLRALALATAYKDIIVTLPPPRLESIPL